MRSRINPYIAGPSVGRTPAFVGREDILRRVSTEIEQGNTNALVLYGQRRIGKTSVLEALTQQLPTRVPSITVFFDIQDKTHEDVDTVLSLLAEAIALRLGLPIPEFGGEVKELFGNTWLPAALASMSRGTRLVVLFDEFDVLADPTTSPRFEHALRALSPYLRQLLENDLPLFMIFTLGRSIGELTTDALALFKGIQSVKISVLGQEDAHRLLSLSEENNSLRWSPEARALAIERTHGHPYLLQQIGKEVWISLVAGSQEPAEGPPLVEAHHVEGVFDVVLAHSQNVLEWLWEGLTPACRLVASAFAEHGPYVASDEELQQILHKSGVRTLIKELIDAPRQLREWDLIESIGDVYRFRVELLRTWIRVNKPLRLVQEELNRLRPQAEYLYLAAAGWEEQGDSERAEQLYREALEQNPSHIQASLALAELYVKRGDLPEAERRLRLLHEDLPAVATPKLLAVLLMRARGAEETEALKLYDDALAVSPHAREARQGRERILVARGRRLEEEGALEEALALFQEAEASADAQRVGEALEQARIDRQLSDLETLEREGNYAAAGKLARALSKELPEAPPRWRTSRISWAQYIEEMEERQSLVEIFHQGKTRLWAGDREYAGILFAEIIRKDPYFEDVARYLYWAVEGRDPEASRWPSWSRWGLVLGGLVLGMGVTVWVSIHHLPPESKFRPERSPVKVISRPELGWRAPAAPGTPEIARAAVIHETTGEPPEETATEGTSEELDERAKEEPPTPPPARKKRRRSARDLLAKAAERAKSECSEDIMGGARIGLTWSGNEAGGTVTLKGPMATTSLGACIRKVVEREIQRAGAIYEMPKGGESIDETIIF